MGGLVNSYLSNLGGHPTIKDLSASGWANIYLTSIGSTLPLPAMPLLSLENESEGKVDSTVRGRSALWDVSHLVGSMQC